MKLIIASLYIALSLASTFAQPLTTSPVRATCTLTPTEAPEIRGIKLGMTVEKVSQAFPQIKDELATLKSASALEHNFGLAQIPVRPPATEPKYSGVEYFKLVFLDEKLVDMAIGYKPVPWRNVDDFLQKFIDAYRLPPIALWQGNAEEKDLQCDDLELGAKRDYFRVSLGSYRKTVQSRDEAAKEKARRDFRP
jgi:hypothetical protein